MRDWAVLRVNAGWTKLATKTFFAAVGVWVAQPVLAQDNPTRELMLAATRGDATAIQSLVDRGADPNAGLNPENGEVGPADPETDFSSALTLSTFCGCIDVTNALIAAGAKPGETDLTLAIGLNQPEVARAMVEAMTFPGGTDELPFIPLLTRRMPAEVSAEFRGFMVRQILTGEVPEDASAMVWAKLFAVAWTRDPNDGIFKLLNALLARGFAIDVADDDLDDTPRTAREMASRNGDILLARALAARGASLPQGWTAAREKEVQLVGAATHGNETGLVMLLGESVSPDASDTDGAYALAAALEGGNFDLAERLLDAGADPRHFGTEQPSPLVSAAKLDRGALVARLIQRGAAPDQLDGTGTFALRIAARAGATLAISELLARGASPTFTDAEGHTALHQLIEPDEVAWGTSPRNRPLNATHYEAVRLLAAAGLPLAALDAEKNSVLASNFGHDKVDLGLMRALLAAGAKPGVAELGRSLGFGDPALLRTLLRDRAPGPLPAGLLLQAAADIGQNADLTVALLEEGVELPVDTGQQQGLLVAAAGASSETALGLLLSRGLSLAVDPEGRALEAALSAGRPKIVKLLASRGANLIAVDFSGRTALHRFVADDARGARPSKIGAAQQAAITALIDAGFALSTPDRDGRSPGALAQAKPTTLVAFNQAIAAAGADATGIHAAVRAGRLDELRRLAGDPALRDSRDALERTPLSLALQSGNWPGARVLLRAGAAISLAPTQPWQPADTSFAGERSISGAFAVRLLSPTLVDIPSDLTPTGIEGVRQAYREGRTLPFADFIWRVRCEARAVTCGNGVTVSGNRKIFFDLLASVRVDRTDRTSFSFIQRNLRSIHLTGRIDLGSLGGPGNLDFGEVTFLLTGAVTIQPCIFAFEKPGCSPGVRIHNPNTDSGLSMLTDTGYEKLPTANLRYTQPGGTSGILAPDETIVLDRSAGPITLEMDEVRTRVFSLSAGVERIAGEAVDPLSADPSTANRMAFFARLAELGARRKDLPSNGAERAADKTLASTIAALSAEAWQAKYPTIVLALLRQQADVIANLDLQVRAIHNAVLAQATYTPAQIDALVAQIDAAIANPATGDVAVLRTIRAELIRLRASAAATGTAVNELRDTLHTDADLYIELFQALILEYRQYVPSSALDTTLDPVVRRAITARVSGREVLIDNAAAGGTGAALRTSFGLPEPHL